MAVGSRRGEGGDEASAVVEGVVVCPVAGCGGQDGGEFGVDEYRDGREVGGSGRGGDGQGRGGRWRGREDGGEVVGDEPVPVAPQRGGFGVFREGGGEERGCEC